MLPVTASGRQGRLCAGCGNIPVLVLLSSLSLFSLLVFSFCGFCASLFPLSLLSSPLLFLKRQVVARSFLAMNQPIGRSYELIQTLPGILWQRVVLPVTTASGRQGRLRATLGLYLQGTLAMW